MSINIDDFRTFVLNVANKSGKGELPTPAQFNSYAYSALLSWVNDVLGARREYQYGRPVPRVSSDTTQATIDDLRFLKYEADMNVVNGAISIPDGSTVTDRNGNVLPEYLRLSTVRGYYYTQTSPTVVKKNEVPVRPVSDDELSLVLDSNVNYPTLKYPVINESSEVLNIYPTTFQYVHLTYFRQPVKPVWAYTTVNNRPVYDAVNSVDLEAPKDAFNEVAMRTLSLLGVNMREADLVQYAEAKK